MLYKMNIFGTVGRKILSIWNNFRNFENFTASIIKSLKYFKHIHFRPIYDTIINQTRFTGIHALPFVVFIALLIGGTVIIQSIKNFPKFGIEDFIGNLLVIIIVREIGPLATAMIVISRSGSAITTEIATQKQNGELLSLEMMGIDTKLYIVFPRIVASIISIFSLMIIFDIVAICGGFLISQLTVYIHIDVFIQSLLDAFNFKDLFSTILKSIIYGVLIPYMCCYYGFMPESKFEIPIYVSKAVIRTLSIIFVINAIISVLFYL